MENELLDIEFILKKGLTENLELKNKVKENISALEGMRDKELSQVIDFLKSVKETYEENEREVRQEVKKMEQTDKSEYIENNFENLLGENLLFLLLQSL